MQRTIVFPVALIVGMCMFTGSQAQELKPVTIAKVSKKDGLTLGNGVSLNRIYPAHSSPFLEKVIEKSKGDPGAKIKLHVVNSSRSLDTVLGVNVDVKARFPFGKAEANTEFNRTTNRNENSYRLVIVGDQEYGDDELKGPQLTPAAAAMIAQGDMKGFAETYGTHFVQREHRVARIAAIISVDRWSEETTQKLKVTASGGGGGIGFSADVKASIQNDFKEANNRGNLSVEISTIGGTGLEGFGDAVKIMLTTQQDFEKSVGEAIGGMLKGFNRDNSGIAAVTVVPYTPFGWKPANLNLWNELFENKLQELAERYYAGRQVHRNLTQIAIPNTDAALKAKLEGYANQYDTYFSNLADFQQNLFEKDQEFVKKKFPKEPEIDAVTAKALLGRVRELSELEARIMELEKSSKYEIQERRYETSNIPRDTQKDPVEFSRPLKRVWVVISAVDTQYNPDGGNARGVREHYFTGAATVDPNNDKLAQVKIGHHISDAKRGGDAGGYIRILIIGEFK